MTHRALTFVFLLAIVACSDESGVEDRSPTNFSGEWGLRTTVVAKAVCGDHQIDEEYDEELSIEQEGSSALLLFADYSVSGSVDGGILQASGQDDDGATVHYEFTRDGDTLLGTAAVAGDGCTEQRSMLASRLVPDADFSGTWEFVLSVIGEVCPDINPTTDCFRIFQTGTDVLIVDEAHGNLTGEVEGTRAVLSRANSLGSVLLTLDMLLGGDSLAGTAIEIDAVENCTTELGLDGTRRGSPCGGPENTR